MRFLTIIKWENLFHGIFLSFLLVFLLRQLFFSSFIRFIIRVRQSFVLICWGHQKMIFTFPHYSSPIVTSSCFNLFWTARKSEIPFFACHPSNSRYVFLWKPITLIPAGWDFICYMSFWLMPHKISSLLSVGARRDGWNIKVAFILVVGWRRGRESEKKTVYGRFHTYLLKGTQSIETFISFFGKLMHAPKWTESVRHKSSRLKPETAKITFLTANTILNWYIKHTERYI